MFIRNIISSRGYLAYTNRKGYFISYEVGLPTKNDDLIEVLPRGFIDVVPYVLQEQNGEQVRVDKINVQVFDYQNTIQ